MKSKEDIAKQFKTHKSITDRGLSKQRENTEKCYKYYEANFFDNSRAGRRPVQIDKVSPYVNAVNGFMIQLRPDVEYAARIQDEPRQEFYSKNANSVSKYIRKNARADQIDTQANKKRLIIGYSAKETAMTYDEGYATTDMNGEVIMGGVTDTVGWDPMAKQTNLVDRRWDYYYNVYSLEDAKKLFGEDEEDFQNVPSDPDTGYNYDPNIYPYDRSKIDDGYDWDSRTDQNVKVYFYSWIQIEDFYRAENPIYKLTNPVAIEQAALFLEQLRIEAEENDMDPFDPSAKRIVFNGEFKSRLEDQFEDLIKPFKFQKKVFYKAVLSGKKVFKAYKATCQKTFTVQFLTGQWNPHSKIWVGMVNSMMEPTLYYNKALESLMYTIDANSKGGLLYEEDAVEPGEAKFLEANYNKTDASIKLRAGGLQKVKEKRSPFQPTGYEQIVQLSNQAVSDTMGFDLAAILSTDVQTGVLHRQLVKQVKSTLAEYFDSFEAYMQECARLLLDMMKVYAENNEGAIIRIIGEDNAQEFFTISKDAFFAEYDIDIKPSLTDEEERNEQAQILIGMGDKLAAIQDPAGKVFYAGALKVMPLSHEQRTEMLEALQSEDPRLAMANQQIQLLQSQIAQLTDQQTRALNAAQLRLIETQASVNQSNIDKNMATVQKTAADTVKVMEEAERTSIENRLAPMAAADKISVSI